MIDADIVREALGDPNLCTPDEFAQQIADALAALDVLEAERDEARMHLTTVQTALAGWAKRAETAEACAVAAKQERDALIASVPAAERAVIAERKLAACQEENLLYASTYAVQSFRRAEVAEARIVALEAELDHARKVADGQRQQRDAYELTGREWRHRAKAMESEVARLREQMKVIAAQQPKTLAMIKANGFVFDSIGNEPGNWQHLAFSIYTDLCEVDSIARAALEEGETT